MDSTNDTQRKAVDWSKPIEAVHVDGRVAPACVALGKPVGWAYCSATSDDGIWHYGLSGSCSWEGWHIRNVQTSKAEHPAIDPVLVERMVVCVEGIAQWHKLRDGQRVEANIDRIGKEARDILKALEPVDRDLLEAREIAANLYGCSPGTIQDYRNGRYDTNPEVINIKAGLKRGRELERERGEAK